MDGKLPKILALTFVKGVYFTAAVVAQTTALPETIFPETLVFENLDQQVTLVKQEQYYAVVNANHGPNRETVKLSKRLIVKTNKSVRQQAIFQFHQQVVDVKPLFVGTLNNYYLIEIKDSAMLANVLSALQNKQGVELVQPDILQLNNNPATTVLKNEPQQRAIEKAQRKEQRLKRRNQRIALRDRAMPEHQSNLTISAYLSLLALPSQWQNNQGKGVKIAIIDDGFNLDHPALQHLNPIFAYDLGSQRLSAAPLTQQDSHGTKVAGIIFAVSKQGPLIGIAPQAELIPLRHTDTWTSKTMLSFHLAALAGVDIINCSWLSPWLMQPVAEIINDLALTGRDGKGTIVVFAAGNQGKEIVPNSSEAALSQAIVVAAHDRQFKRLINSNYGQSVDVTVYGGPVLTTFPHNKYGYFSETSMAAAIVSGLVALLLSQQPQLTLDQVQQRLVLLTEPPTQGLKGKTNDYGRHNRAPE